MHHEQEKTSKLAQIMQKLKVEGSRGERNEAS